MMWMTQTEDIVGLAAGILNLRTGSQYATLMLSTNIMVSTDLSLLQPKLHYHNIIVVIPPSVLLLLHKLRL